MKYCTVINCIDGRVQLPVINYLKQRFKAEWVDSITEAGPNLLLSEMKNSDAVKSILDRLENSVKKHNSIGLAIVGHYDCLGNPAPKDKQIEHLQNAVKQLRQHYPEIEIIGLWVDDKWQVQEVAE